MRSLIKLSAVVFILLGALTFAVAAVAGISAASSGAASEYATYPAMIGFGVALAGLVAGASLVLVGGTAYLLASIDERLEIAATERVLPPTIGLVNAA
jgi:hypothetical protein